MNYLLKLSILLTFMTSFHQASAATTVRDTVNRKRILFVCTSEAEFNHHANGTFLSEIAVPFILFQELGYEIDIVSPKGGVIPIYYKFDTTEIMHRALQSPYYQNKISNSLKPDQVMANKYAAVIIPGGYGQFLDVHSTATLNHVIVRIYEQNGCIGTLGHGASTLVNLKNSKGDFLVKGKTLTCFPTWFEKEIMTEADHGTLLPFDMEFELHKRGAHLKSVDKVSGTNKEIVDANNRIVTAAFSIGGEFIVDNIHKLITEIE